MTDTNTPLSRKVMSTILGALDLSDGTRAELEAADYYIDESLDAVDNEEPSLLEWLQTDPEIQRLHWSNQSTMYWTLMAELKKSTQLDKIAEKIDALQGRLLATVAWRATMRERARR